MFSPEQVSELDAPLSKAVVKKNPRGFDYVEAWHAIAEANRIFGHDGWVRELLDLRVIGERQAGEQWRISYRATVRITAGGIYRDGSGFGSGVMRDYEQAHESALKEAESDAMKRALMTFGNPFGLALYDKAKTNVSDGREAYSPDNPPPAAKSTATGRQNPNSLAQKQRDGVMEAMFAEIDGCIDMVELRQWWKDHATEIKALPSMWQDAISDRKEARKIELEIGPATEELDAGFRGAIGHGGERSEGVAGRADQVPA